MLCQTEMSVTPSAPGRLQRELVSWQPSRSCSLLPWKLSPRQAAAATGTGWCGSNHVPE